MSNLTVDAVDRLSLGLKRGHDPDATQELFKVLEALRGLLEQVDSLEGYELTRDIPQHEAQSIWEHAIAQARRAIDETK